MTMPTPESHLSLADDIRRQERATFVVKLGVLALVLAVAYCAMAHAAEPNWRQLEIVNRQINETTIYDPRPGWHNANNCAGMAVRKRALLLAEGVSPAEMRFAVLRLPDHRVHAVLVVAGWVLDNMRSHVYPVSEMPGRVILWRNRP